MSGDAKWALGVGTVVVAVFCAAWIVSHVLITLGTVIRSDLHELRESLERAACGEFARVAPSPIGGQRAGRPADPLSDAPRPDGGNGGGKPAAASCSGP